MKALISTKEEKHTGYRVAQVEPDDKIFPVGPDLFWVDCVEGTKADYYWYDPIDGIVKPNLPPTADENKKWAAMLLMETDWVNEPDVTNTSVNPHLLNYQDFINYRAILRDYAVNPRAGDLDWPVKPTAQWSPVP